MEYAIFVGTFVSMRTEVVTLCLDQVGGQNRRTVAVVVVDRSREGWRRDTVLNGIRHDITQRLLIFISNVFEVRSQQQVSDRGIFSIRIGNFLQELCTNNTTRTENLRDFTVVQIPVVLI